MAVIEFERVSKAYRLGTGRTSLREAITQVPRKLFSRKDSHDDRLFWALNDVSFCVEHGEVLGIIGPNGAGKSTILKLLSKVTFPTNGRVWTQGRVAALIELGAGFHPDLSGRENVYLNGAILGLKKREIDAAFSDIVKFAELEEFVDTPVKRYSSGMYVRLAFAVAAHVKADLILIDEVLSVGDITFQQRCLAKMNELHSQGATIVFVSHDLWTVQSFCTRTVLLQRGQVEADGNPERVIDIYRQRERKDQLARAQPANASGASEATDETRITEVKIMDRDGQPAKDFYFNGHLLIRAQYVAPRRIKAPVFLVRIRRSDGLICCAITNRNTPDFFQKSIGGEGSFEVRIGPLPLIPDMYTVETLIIDSKQPIVYASSPREAFRVKGQLSGSNDAGVFAPNAEWFPQAPRATTEAET